MSKLFGDVEDKRAVLMGNGSTLKTVLIMNVITAVLFFLQGTYMYTVVGTTKQTVETIESRPIEECAQTLQSQGMRPQDPKKVHTKTKKYFCLAICTMILLFMASGLRVLITSDSLDREYRIVSTFERMHQQDHDAPPDAAQDSGNAKNSNQKMLSLNAQDTMAWNFIRAMK